MCAGTAALVYQRQYHHEVGYTCLLYFVVFFIFNCLCSLFSKKKRSKWDQVAPDGPAAAQDLPSSLSSTAGHDNEPSVSAAVAAARLNAMLEAKGKLLKVCMVSCWCVCLVLFRATQRCTVLITDCHDSICIVIYSTPSSKELLVCQFRCFISECNKLFVTWPICNAKCMRCIRWMLHLNCYTRGGLRICRVITKQLMYSSVCNIGFVRTSFQSS